MFLLNQSLNFKVVALLDVDAVDPSGRDEFVGFLWHSMFLSLLTVRAKLQI